MDLVQSSRDVGIIVPLVDEITAILRERIYSQVYGPGYRLKQEALCSELGISRTPLREAMQRLEQEGLIRSEPGRGARVVSGDVQTLLAAYQVRAVIDGLAARLVAAGPTHEHVGELRKSIERQKAAMNPWDARQYSNCNVDFHERICRMTENEFVIGQVSLIHMTAKVFTPVALIDRDNAERAIGEHSAICSAIAAGDERAAEHLARAHIEQTITELTERDSGRLFR
ncbi:GntR family transcriptional regulator [Rhodococcus sp. NPDC079359]|uniref:GntR family transcriptional regulator n=1 Tax=Rhodococcus sp. NPDC079359 TaxID=3154961 RepID=UPI00344E7FD5